MKQVRAYRRRRRRFCCAATCFSNRLHCSVCACRSLWCIEFYYEIHWDLKRFEECGKRCLNIADCGKWIDRCSWPVWWDQWSQERELESKDKLVVSISIIFSDYISDDVCRHPVVCFLSSLDFYQFYTLENQFHYSSLSFDDLPIDAHLFVVWKTNLYSQTAKSQQQQQKMI